MANVIKFDCNYPKLCNQAHAQLVKVEEVYLLPDSLKYQALVEYDTKRPDGTYLKLKRATYLLLFFVGDKGIMFSTFRTPSTENVNKFLDKEGSWFEVVVKDGDAQ